MSKVILVTGGSSGIGLGIAQHLSDLGHEVYASSRNTTNGTAMQDFKMVKLDVTDVESIESALQYIIAQSGRIDVLVNNAGLGMIGPLENTDLSEMKAVFDTNVFGLLSVCQKSIPHMRTSGGGQIINITSLGGQIGLPFRGIYCGSKFAVEGLSEVLSMELKSSNIQVSIIEPGDVKTNINDNRLVSKEVNKTVYGEAFGRISDQIHKEVDNGQTPDLIAKKVAYIVDQKKPSLRYQAAGFTQKLGIHVKKIVPGRVFEKLIMNLYKL